ncbi:hypothetical protein F5148DRAFT_1015432 [Russula earlei]|uniref:Uncharacterized protein n=1 Tax=Russula earlei TaxID=71964 RepID=A0ACC0U5Y3_9AGAM|nr:hypothetical protein F5148DRAFT_1015432 [Russula earlei]
MADQLDQSTHPRPLDKGKAKAQASNAFESHQPTEITPLLASRSYVIIADDDDILQSASRSNDRGSLLSTLTTVFLITLSISILLVLLLLSLAFSYAAKASQLSEDDILHTGLAFHGPDAIKVLNVSIHGDVWMRLDGHVGFDAGETIGVKPSLDDSFWLDLWKAIGRWGIRNLDTVSLTLSSINISSRYDPSEQLASVEVPPFQIPLTANPPEDASWLTPISLPVHIHPSRNISAWFKFASESWRRGYAIAQATVSRAGIQGGTLRRSSWRNALRMDRSNVTVGLHMKIPALPSLPVPGSGRTISDFVHLTNFSLSSRAHDLIIDAAATMVNPAPSIITFTSPPLPFVIWIPPPLATIDHSLVPLASVTAEPFNLTHPNITLSLRGKVLPIPLSATPALSSLLSDYLSGIDHPISITSSLELFSNYTSHTKFPAPVPRPELLRNVTIEDMRIHASGTTILASGIVHARIAFPEGVDVTLFVNRILPDALVFDGPLPTASLPVSPSSAGTTTKRSTKDMARINGNRDDGDDDDDDDDDIPPAPPLPSPLPSHAFARVRPDAWLSALSARTAPRRDWNERGNTTLSLSAWFVDVPLEVLPGREREFRSFVTKVIFSPGEGAVAGVQGVAAVGVRVAGRGGMVLTGLPFRGSVRVGKKG